MIHPELATKFAGPNAKWKCRAPCSHRVNFTPVTTAHRVLAAQVTCPQSRPATQAILAAVTVTTIAYSCTPVGFKSENKTTTEFSSCEDLGFPRITAQCPGPQSLARSGPRKKKKIRKTLKIAWQISIGCWSWAKPLNQPILQIRKLRP